MLALPFIAAAGAAAGIAYGTWRVVDKAFDSVGGKKKGGGHAPKAEKKKDDHHGHGHGGGHGH